MPRLMSVALTEAAVRSRTKTVTRRLGWKFLKPGDRLVLCPKVMGRRGAPLERICTVEVISVRRERLWDLTEEDILREAVPDLPGRFEEHFLDAEGNVTIPTPLAWVEWFCEQMGCKPDDFVTRIEWRYLDESGTARQDTRHRHPTGETP